MVSISRIRTFQALSNRNFRLLWMGQLGASMAMWMETVTRGWLVWQLTKDPLMLGLVMMFRAVPMLLFSPVAGVTADRINKRNILLACEVITMMLHLALAFLITTGLVQIWHIFLTAFLSGISMCFNQPTRQALVPVLVGRENLQNAVGLNSAVMNISRILGPSIAGVLIAFLDIGGTYYVQAAVYLLVISMTLMMVVPDALDRRTKDSAWTSFAEGINYISNNRAILGLVITALVPMIFAMPYATLLPVFADEVFGIGASGLGLLNSAPGIGALTAAMLIASATNLRNKGKVLLVGVFAFGALLIAFSLSPALGLSLGLLVFVGVSQQAFMTMMNTLLLTLTPSELQGRIMSIYMLDRGLMPLGSVMAGWIASAFGAPIALVVMGSVCVFLALSMGSLFPVLRKLE